MSFKKRNLIVFQSPEIGNGIYNELSAHDWDVYVAEDIQQATELLDKHIFKVGLCLIDENCNTRPCLLGKTCLIDKCTSTRKLTQLNQLFSRVGRVSDSVTRQIEVPLCRSGFATPTETFEVFNGFQNLWDGVIDPVPPGRKNLPIRRIQSLA